jgi:NitT/TauT family transport system permease protein
MAGELLVIVNHQPSLGQRLHFASDLADAEQLVALMIVIFVIGVVIDSLFGTLDRAIRQRWGLGGEA